MALNDPRVLDMLDMKIFVEADPDLCLSRRSELSFSLSLDGFDADVGVSKLSVMSGSAVGRSKGLSSSGSHT